MKTITKLFFISLIIFFTSFTAFSQKVNFSGEWKLNREKTVIADNQLFLSKITIQLKSDSLLTNRVYENGMGEEYPFQENLTLDGKEHNIVIFDMPRSSKALRAESGDSIMIDSKTTFTGSYGEDNLMAKETWKVDNNGNTLVIKFNNKMSEGETTGTNYYDKVK